MFTTVLLSTMTLLIGAGILPSLVNK